MINPIIYKYPLPYSYGNETFKLTVPNGILLDIQFQNKQLVSWFIQEQDITCQTLHDFEITLIGTGIACRSDLFDGTYIKTLQDVETGLVWHIFAKNLTIHKY